MNGRYDKIFGHDRNHADPALTASPAFAAQPETDNAYQPCG
jgi:hypothetical protein